jgi:hypothetical protein
MSPRLFILTISIILHGMLLAQGIPIHSRTLNSVGVAGATLDPADQQVGYIFAQVVLANGALRSLGHQPKMGLDINSCLARHPSFR